MDDGVLEADSVGKGVTVGEGDGCAVAVGSCEDVGAGVNDGVVTAVAAGGKETGASVADSGGAVDGTCTDGCVDDDVGEDGGCEDGSVGRDIDARSLVIQSEASSSKKLFKSFMSRDGLK